MKTQGFEATQAQEIDRDWTPKWFPPVLGFLLGFGAFALLVAFVPREPSDRDKLIEENRGLQQNLWVFKRAHWLAEHDWLVLDDPNMPPAQPSPGIDRPAGSSWQWFVNDCGELFYKRLDGPK